MQRRQLLIFLFSCFSLGDFCAFISAVCPSSCAGETSNNSKVCCNEKEKCACKGCSCCRNCMDKNRQPPFDICMAGTVNLSTAHTYQSSNYIKEDQNPESYTPDKAIDHNVWTCSHTKKSVTKEWWKIDLRGVYNISSVFIFNKCADNSDISNAQMHIGYFNDTGNGSSSCQETIKNFKQNCYNQINFTYPLGRYIYVDSATKAIVLCDLKVCGTKEESPFELVKKNKTWEQALDYCRQNGKDLATILDDKMQAWAELEAMNADSDFVWLGLRYTCTLSFWFWVQDYPLKYEKWNQTEKFDHCDMSAAMEKTERHLWFSKPDGSTFNFICTNQ